MEEHDAATTVGFHEEDPRSFQDTADLIARALVHLELPFELQALQDRGRLAGVISGLPIPGPSRIGRAEGGLRSRAQDGGVDAASAFEIGEEKPRGLGDRGERRRERCHSRAGRLRSWKDSS